MTSETQHNVDATKNSTANRAVKKVLHAAVDKEFNFKTNFTYYGFDHVSWSSATGPSQLTSINKNNLKSWWTGSINERIKKLNFLGTNLFVVSVAELDIDFLKDLSHSIKQSGGEFVLNCPLGTDLSKVTQIGADRILFDAYSIKNDSINSINHLFSKLKEKLPNVKLGLRFSEFTSQSLVSSIPLDFIILEVKSALNKVEHGIDSTSLRKLISKMKSKSPNLEALLSLSFNANKNALQEVSPTIFYTVLNEIDQIDLIDGLIFNGLGYFEMDFAHPDLHEIRTAIRTVSPLKSNDRAISSDF